MTRLEVGYSARSAGQARAAFMTPPLRARYLSKCSYRIGIVEK